MSSIELCEPAAGPRAITHKGGKVDFSASLQINFSLSTRRERIVHHTRKSGKQLSDCKAMSRGWGIRFSGVWRSG